MMKVAAAKRGRTFVIRLYDGEIVHQCIERFAAAEGIRAATLRVVGGVGAGTRLVVGPADGRASPITPMEHRLDEPHEATGVGTLFPDEEGRPVVRMHMACGRGMTTVTGCIRRGVVVWKVLEVVLDELLETRGVRVFDPASGFAMLDPDPGREALA